MPYSGKCAGFLDLLIHWRRSSRYLPLLSRHNGPIKLEHCPTLTRIRGRASWSCWRPWTVLFIGENRPGGFGYQHLLLTAALVSAYLSCPTIMISA